MTTTVRAFPAIRPGFKLVPAVIGTPATGQQIVYIECPNWCTEDHVNEWQHSVDDVSHWGDYYGAGIPSLTAEGPVLELSARLFADPTSQDVRLREAHVLVEGLAGADAHLTPTMAEQTADDLIKLAAKLRTAARSARLARNGDSDPDMDGALRRVREGQSA
ncbi:DUF6907 domain-containing protein [Streptomyces sp. NPDC102467]|uniref:DUF6907 domain-containing protein n=1 Tax=Streptomyces sp. NPDC102467 TaxID=3366179 RepID=UPI003816C45F